MVVTTNEARYIIVLGIVISVLPISSTSPLGQNTTKRRTLPKEAVKIFPDRRFWNCGWFSYKAAKCVA
jgi:hypothetical protein